MTNEKTGFRAPTDRFSAATRLSILGGFGLTHGTAPTSLTPGSQRLLAVLALQGRSSQRAQVAGMLWPEATEVRAYACLRSSLARVVGAGPGLLDVTASDVGLAQGVGVDLVESRALAHRLLDDRAPLRDDDTAPAMTASLLLELLPGWYEEWVLFEAEAWRQLRLHALEALTQRLVVDLRYGEAAVVAVAATGVDPLRESARAALIKVHLAEHNQSEARREFDRYRKLLRAELDVEPTPALRALVDDTALVTLR